MKAPAQDPVECYAGLVRSLGSEPGVTVGAGKKKGFGAGALSVRGRIFAMLSSRNRFVVKLPSEQVDALVAAGIGTRFEAGRGRPMKEWLEVGAGQEASWENLARAALLYVARPTPKR